jgi:hypothetical protein
MAKTDLAREGWGSANGSSLQPGLDRLFSLVSANGLLTRPQERPATHLHVHARQHSNGLTTRSPRTELPKIPPLPVIQ